MIELRELRNEHPAVLKHTYLNTGTAGPMSRRVKEAIAREVESECEDGRLHRGFERYLQALDGAREAMAGLMGVEASDVALTTSTGDGLNAVLHGLDWKPGDELVTTLSEHESSLLPAAVLRARRGIVTRFAAFPEDPAQVQSELGPMLGPRTRLVMVSHVSYSTGAVLPLAAVTACAHARGIPVLVDGAQSFAAIDTAMGEADFYAVSGQKWLCGPEGTGALYVNPKALAQVAQTFIGYYSIARCEEDGSFEPAQGARRFEVGTRYLPAVFGQRAAAQWFADVVGPERAWARIHALASRLLEGLAAIDDVEVITPAAAHAGLVTFRPPGEPERLVQRLLTEHGILCRAVPFTPWVRMSAGWYNLEEEIERALQAVAACRSSH